MLTTHFVVIISQYSNIESLCCIYETNIMFYGNYSSITTFLHKIERFITSRENLSQQNKQKPITDYCEKLIQYPLYLIISNPILYMVFSLFLNVLTSYWRLSKLLDNLFN